LRYILKRLGFYAIAAWASLTLNFFLPRMMPGDPASRLFGRIQHQMRPEELEALKEVFGFSKESLIKQYFTYLSHALRGDLGVSISRFPSPVTEVIATGFEWTILLGATALIISFVIGNIIGIFGTWRRGGVVDTIVPPLLIFIGSFPYFWLSMVVLYYLGFEKNWFPLRHAYDFGLTQGWNLEYIKSVIEHLLLPAGTIVLVSIGGWALGMRNTMVNVLAEDYVMLAEAKGLPQRRIMFNYAARNAMLPAITSFGMSIGFILSGALLTEIVFSYPGVGFLLLMAVQQLDYPLLQGLLLNITLAVLGANLIVDLLYTRLDPRVRTQ
jgi:peptide/nickel transport system permease protein